MKLVAADIIKHIFLTPDLQHVNFSELQPFVLSKEVMEEEAVSYDITEEHQDIILAAPFSKFSFEVERDFNGLGVLGEIIPYKNTDQKEFQPNESYELFWVGCEELSPNEYKFNVLLSKWEGENAPPIPQSVTLTSGDDYYKAIIALVQSFIRSLHKGDTGFVGGTTSIKMKKVKTKKRFSLNKPIYISKKRANHLTTTVYTGEPIVRINSWSVMGHWRRIDQATMGKDRLGHYNVPGYTWISHHVRGDKSLGGRIATRKVIT